MSNIHRVSDQFYKTNHVWPHRILLRDQKNWFRVLDVQTKVEKNHSISVYVKPPFEGLYIAEKPSHKLSLPKDGFVDIKLPISTNGTSTLNPYLSWHSSGKLHANGFSDINLKKEVFLKDSEAIKLEDLSTSPHIILSAVMPVNSLSYYPTTPPPSNFEGNYFEISNNPHLPNKLDRQGNINIILDRACLKQTHIVLDLILHSPDMDVSIEENLPYPNNAEILFVSHPIKLTFSDPKVALSFFFYQPIGKSIKIVQKEKIILWGRSKNQDQDLLFQVVKFP